MKRSLLLITLLTGVFVSINAHGYCSVWGDCEQRYCRTYIGVSCPGSGVFCVACGFAYTPCTSLGSAIPYGQNACAFCGGPCHSIVASEPVRSELSSSDSPLHIPCPSEVSDGSVIFDLDLSPGLSELGELLDTLPWQVEALLRFERVAGFEGFPRATTQRWFMMSQGSADTVRRRVEARRTLLLEDDADRRTREFIGPFDRLVEIALQPMTEHQLMVEIRSYRVQEWAEEYEFEASTQIIARADEMTAGRYAVVSINVDDDTTSHIGQASAEGCNRPAAGDGRVQSGTIDGRTWDLFAIALDNLPDRLADVAEQAPSHVLALLFALELDGHMTPFGERLAQMHLPGNMSPADGRKVLWKLGEVQNLTGTDGAQRPQYDEIWLEARTLSQAYPGNTEACFRRFRTARSNTLLITDGQSNCRHLEAIEREEEMLDRSPVTRLDLSERPVGVARVSLPGSPWPWCGPSTAPVFSVDAIELQASTP